MKTLSGAPVEPPSRRTARDALALTVVLVVVQAGLVVAAVAGAVQAVVPADRPTGRSIVCVLEGAPGTLPIAGATDGRAGDVPLDGASCVLADPADEVTLVGEARPAARPVGEVAVGGALPEVAGCTTRSEPDGFASGTQGDLVVAEFHFECVHPLSLGWRITDAVVVALLPAALVVAGAQLLRRLLAPLRRRQAVDFSRAGTRAVQRLRTLSIVLAAVTAVGAVIDRSIDRQVVGYGSLSLFRPGAALVAAAVFSVLATIWSQAAELQAEQEGVV